MMKGKPCRATYSAFSRSKCIAFGVGQRVEAGAGLFRADSGVSRLASGELAREIGMGLQHGQAFVLAGARNTRQRAL